MDNFQNSNNNNEYPLNTINTFTMDPTLESELKKLLENKNKTKNIKLDKLSFLSKNIQSIGNQIPLLFCNITRLYLSNNNLTTLEGIDQFANLTHLSISYNLIEDIYELNRIINPEILLFLNVKGNFFCKNPSYVEVILNLFLNLKSLDDLKINNNHKKQIKYGQDLSKLIMPFLLDIQEKIEKISNLYSVSQFNNEYDLSELNNINENTLSKILSLTNEKKTLNNNNIIPSIYELNNLIAYYLNNSIENNLITSERNNIKSIYEELFTSLILNQKRKDYRGFINYLIMSSDQKLLEYIKNKGNSLKYLEMNKTSFNIICQNFEKILMNNSNYTMENINEIQMMIFYMYFNGNNIMTNDDNDIEIIYDENNKNEKIILNNYEKKIINFREIIPNYFPIFPLDTEFMKSLMNLIKDKINLLNNYINEIRKGNFNKNNNNLSSDINNKENNNGNEEANHYDDEDVNEQNIEDNNDRNNNMSNNFNENNNIKNINTNNNTNKNNYKDNSNKEKTYIIENENDENENELNVNNNTYNLNQPFIYNSQNESNNEFINSNDKSELNYSNKRPNLNEQINSYNKNDNNIHIQENQDNSNNNYNKSFPNLNQNVNTFNINEQNQKSPTFNKFNKETKKFNNTIPNLEPNMAQIQMKYNIIQCTKIINKIIFNNLYQTKYFFFENLKKIQYISRIGQIFFTLQTSLYRLLTKNFFTKLKQMKNNGYNRYNLGKKFFNYESNKYNYEFNHGKEENNENVMNQKALIFYYSNLKRKIFMLFKFNFFCYNKKANYYLFNKNNKKNIEDNKNSINNNNNENEENNNLQKYLNNDNLLNSNAYKFFHGNEKENENEEKLEKDKNMNNDKVLNYNNSIEINDNVKDNNENDNNNIKNNKSNNEIDYFKDKNYNNALELRKILEEKDEDLNDTNIENKKDNKLEESKNEVDDLLNNLNKLYNELNDKTRNSQKSKKSGINNSSNLSYNKNNKEYLNRLKKVREKERDKARKKCGKNRKIDENKLLGCPNFLKNTYNSLSKNI